MTAPSSASLTCQRCMQPIRLDDSLTDEALSSSATSNDGFARSHYDVISNLVPKIDTTPPQTSARKDAAAADTDSDLAKAVARHLDLHAGPASTASSTPNSLSTAMDLHARLFDLVSSYVPRTPSSDTIPSSSRAMSLGIDHPLCRDCADFCIEAMRSLLDVARKDRDAFKEWNRHLESETHDRSADDEVRKMEAEIVELEDLIGKATSSLRRSEREREALEAEMRQLDVEERQLEREEAEFWNAHSKTLLEEKDVQETRATLLRGIQMAEASLARLNATNVFFDAFCIGHEGGGSGSSSSSRKRGSGGTGLATINGLRFGRTSSSSSSSSSSSVDWNEVNAAWGQVALLVETLRTRISKGREFRGWRIRPKGSTSYLDKVVTTAGSSGNGDDEARDANGSPSASTSASYEPHELHHPNSWASLTRVLHLRRFDAAMVGVLDCTSQLYRWAEEEHGDQRGSTADQQAPPRMVHAINGDRIGDYSVRLVGAFTSEENWSRALKYLLVNLQVLMHWNTRDEAVPVPNPRPAGEAHT